MNEATRLSVSVSHSGKRNQRFVKALTLEKLIGWIEQQGLDEYTTNGLIEMAAKYPSHALVSFRKNFNLMVQRVRAKRRKEVEAGIVPPLPEDVVSPTQTEKQFVSFDEALNAEWDNQDHEEENTQQLDTTEFAGNDEV